MPTLRDIALEAREWEHTPYHDLMRRKKQGCDCIGLIMGVGRMVKAKIPNDREVAFYGRTPHGGVAEREADKFMTRIGTTWNQVVPGTIGLFWWRRPGEGQHFGIFDEDDATGRLMIIHAYYSSTRVVRTGVNEFWRKRLKYVYTLRGVTT